jgi:hypothetical protein
MQTADPRIDQTRPPWDCELQIHSLDDDVAVPFRAALYADGVLSFITGATPFKQTFRASRVIFSLESMSRGAQLRAALFSNRYGASRRVLGFGGSHGYMFESDSGSSAGTDSGHRSF